MAETLPAALKHQFATDQLRKLHEYAVDWLNLDSTPGGWGALVDALFVAAYPRDTPPTDPLEPPVDELPRLRNALTATEHERDETRAELNRIRTTLINTVRREYYDRLMDRRSALGLITDIGYDSVEALSILENNEPVEVKDVARLGSSCRARVLPTAEELAREFHKAYEDLAPAYGYRTREESAKPWVEVPERNRALMIATAAHVLGWLFGDQGKSEQDSDNRRENTISVIMMYPFFDHGSRYESIVKGLIREPAYEAARSVIRRFPASAKQNGRLWRAVEAALDAMGIPAGAVDGQREVATRG